MFTLSIVLALPVKGEGGEKRPKGVDWGVNRRVRTIAGYYAVSGNSTINFGMPPGITPGDTSTNPQGDHPSFYMGGHAGGVEVDSGLEYQWGEPISYGTDKNGHPIYHQTVPGITDHYPVGWTADVFANGFYSQPKVWDQDAIGQWGAVPWRPRVNPALPPGPSNPNLSSPFSTDMTFTFNANGTANLYVSELRLLDQSGRNLGVVSPGAFYWVRYGHVMPSPTAAQPLSPSSGDVISPYMDPTDPSYIPNWRSRANVKRVVAMTRAQPATGKELDGSWMSCVFTNGQVAKDGGNLQPWLPADVDQKGDGNTGSQLWFYSTGHDAPGGSGKYAYDLQQNTHKQPTDRLTIVEFPNVQTSSHVLPNGHIVPAGNMVAREDYPESWVGYELVTVNSVQQHVTRYQHEEVWINLRRSGHQVGNLAGRKGR